MNQQHSRLHPWAIQYIEKAINTLSPKELQIGLLTPRGATSLPGDKELDEDFAPGGKREKALEKIDSEIESGNFTPFP